ncbi:XdhC family protein, partial [Caulobacter sp.]|uniref:XdhC family protein n=1 Tax=Caulobacter sp. TaxID=78 RepID=UPI003BB0C4E8
MNPTDHADADATLVPEAEPSDWPLHGLADDMRPALAGALARGPAALATIIFLGDGGPRPVGTQMVFGQDALGGGSRAGFLSGGCIEADVEGHARACMVDGRPRRLVYGEGSPWPDIRLLCGARIEILVERITPDDSAARALLALTAARAPAIWISDGDQRRCAPAAEDIQPWPGAFSRRFDPPPRLVVFGGDPTALAVAGLGAQSGFQTTLVRPKGPTSPPPLPGVAYRRDEVAAAVASIGLDAWTAVAICGHDEAIDHQALLAALPSAAPYV